MGGFACVSVPVDLSRRPAAAEVALEAVANYPGTQSVSIDAASGVLSFEIEFPGNLSGLVNRLRDCHIPVGEQATVSLAVRRTAPASGDADAERHILEQGPEIWDVQFPRGRYVLSARIEGDSRLEAAIVPSTNSMHQLYDALLHLRYLSDGGAARASRP